MKNNTVLEQIKERYNSLSTSEKKAASYIYNNPDKAVDYNISELAGEVGVSDASIVRMCKHLGYTGYYQMRLLLSKNNGMNSTRESEVKDNKVRKLFDTYIEQLSALSNVLNEEDLIRSINLIRSTNYIHIIAVGNTTPLALYMGFRLGRLGIRCTYNISPEYFMNQINLAQKCDLVIAISQSGESKQLIQGINLAKEKELKVISITSEVTSSIACLSDIILLSSGRKEPFNIMQKHSYLREMAVIEILLDNIDNREKVKSLETDKAEIILSESKL